MKNTNIDRSLSYMFTIEYDMPEFALAERFNYAEMAALIAPRPFMVERGHNDGVAPDEWVGYEYAKVKRLYDSLGLADRVEIAYFNGGHMIDGRAPSRSWPGTWTGHRARRPRDQSEIKRRSARRHAFCASQRWKTRSRAATASSSRCLSSA